MSGPISKIGNSCPKIGFHRPRRTLSAALCPGIANGSKLCSSILIRQRTTLTASWSTWIISRTDLQQGQFYTTLNKWEKPDSKSGIPSTTSSPFIQKRKTSPTWYLWKIFARQLQCLWPKMTFWLTWRMQSGLGKLLATLCSTSKWSKEVTSLSRWAKTWLGLPQMWWTS